jgi:hypothetical protein
MHAFRHSSVVFEKLPIFVCISIMSILSRINEIRDQAFASYGLTDTTPLSHHKLGFDKMHRRVYVEAEIRPEFLDRGDYPTELSMRWLGHNSVPGDCMLQLIDEKLGGPGKLREYL